MLFTAEPCGILMIFFSWTILFSPYPYPEWLIALFLFSFSFMYLIPIILKMFHKLFKSFNELNKKFCQFHRIEDMVLEDFWSSRIWTNLFSRLLQRCPLEIFFHHHLGIPFAYCVKPTISCFPCFHFSFLHSFLPIPTLMKHIF